MHALFAFEDRQPVCTLGDGLSGAHSDAGLFGADGADACVTEGNVVGESGHGLDLAAHEQRVLLRDKQLAVEWNLGPSALGQQRIVQRSAARRCSRSPTRRISRRIYVRQDVTRSVRLVQECAFDPEASPGKTSERHPDQACDQAAVESVACIFGLARSALNPASPAGAGHR